MIRRAQIEAAHLAELHWQVRKPRIVLVRHILQAHCLTQAVFTRAVSLKLFDQASDYLTVSHSHCFILAVSLSLLHFDCLTLTPAASRYACKKQISRLLLLAVI